MTYIPLYDKPLVWVDTETTGLDPQNNDIIEIAIIKTLPSGNEISWHTKIKMERPESAHPKALAVNGYTDEGWADAVDPATIWRELADTGLLENCILAGHNVGFDADFINATFVRHGIKLRVDYHKYDTVTLALEHLKPWLKSASLVSVCGALGIPTDGAHGAMADVRMAMEVNRVLTTATTQEKMRRVADVPARIAAWEALRAHSSK